MNVVEKAKKHLSEITAGNWKGVIFDHPDRESYDTWMNKMSSGNDLLPTATEMAFVHVDTPGDNLMVVCVMGNGKDGVVNADFVANAPALVKELVAKIEELKVQYSDTYTRYIGAHDNAVKFKKQVETLEPENKRLTDGLTLSREQTQDAEKRNLRLAKKLDTGWSAVELAKAKKKTQKVKDKLKALRTEFAEQMRRSGRINKQQANMIERFQTHAIREQVEYNKNQKRIVELLATINRLKESRITPDQKE